MYLFKISGCRNDVKLEAMPLRNCRAAGDESQAPMTKMKGKKYTVHKLDTKNVL